MTKTQHTPGPWALMDKGDYSDFNGDSRVILSEEISGENPFRIAVVHVSDDEAEANARLIAAAPDLLEVLIAALPYIETAESDEAYKPGAVQKITHQVKAAIAKAGYAS